MGLHIAPHHRTLEIAVRVDADQRWLASISTVPARAGLLPRGVCGAREHTRRSWQPCQHASFGIKGRVAALGFARQGQIARDAPGTKGLPADQQDWGALQAFVTSASEDREIRAMTVVDANNIVRAASDDRRIGAPYAAPQQEARVGAVNGAVVTYVGTGQDEGMRIVQPIRYAGASYGKVDVVVRTEALVAATNNTRWLLLMLSLVVMVTVMLVGYLSGAAVTRPLGRLRKALDEAATSRFALRISHRRGDEFGAAFDAFNRAAGAAEEKFAAGAADDEVSMLATRIAEPTAVPVPQRQVA